MIIGISGYARAGKNTVADILGPDYRQVSFAEPMRTAMMTLNPIIHMADDYEEEGDGTTRLADMVNDTNWEFAKKATEVRRLLQVFGTEVGRKQFGENFWVDIAMKDVKVGDDVVFTDVRFPNEAQAIVDRGGEVWRINRTGVGAVNDHPSEHSMDDWRFHKVIENDGTLEELKEKVFG